VGTGEEEESLKETANALNVKGITWAGFKQLDELPIYYSLATALVLPSLSEPWGLVVNEGMACFLPILCSDRCGCMLDLVFPGINGCIFNPYSVQNIANALEQITLKTSKELAEMGQSSQNLIRQYTPETWSKSLIDCIEVTLRTSLST
jgi:glycosyltransferase involved in cell wall biosynthesis